MQREEGGREQVGKFHFGGVIGDASLNKDMAGGCFEQVLAGTDDQGGVSGAVLSPSRVALESIGDRSTLKRAQYEWPEVPTAGEFESQLPKLASEVRDRLGADIVRRALPEATVRTDLVHQLAQELLTGWLVMFYGVEQNLSDALGLTTWQAGLVRVGLLKAAFLDDARKVIVAGQSRRLTVIDEPSGGISNALGHGRQYGHDRSSLLVRSGPGPVRPHAPSQRRSAWRAPGK
jgi:hypothetical protein